MELSSRCIQILREVSREKGGLPVTELLSRLNITRRVLYYNVSKINDWLYDFKLGKMEISSGQLLLDTDSPHEVERLLGSFSSYVFSAEERRALEILSIALSSSPTTSDYFQSLFDVSKNTIHNDIKECKTQLEPLCLSIGCTSKHGYCLLGEEVAVRKLIGQQLDVLKNEYPRVLLGNLFQTSLAALTGNSGIDFRQLVKEGVEDYERKLGTWFVPSDMAPEEAMILAACIRCVKGYPYPVDLQEKETLKNTREYSSVLLITSKLFEAGISLNMDEAFYITILFLGIKNFDFSSTAAENDFIQQFAVSLVDNFERIACVSFKDRRQFLNRLCLHIRPMYYRLKYGIRAKSELLGQIQTMYAFVYEFTRQAVERTSGEMSSLISEEELAYLCVYMASYLKGGTVRSEHYRQKILIICGAGVAASVLLREQLSELLGDAFEYDMLPARRVENQNLSGYCVIVTTVPIDEENERVIQTSPILSEEVKDRIVNSICRSGVYISATQEAEEILEVVRRNIRLTDESRLMRELVRYTIRKEQAISHPPSPPKMRELLQSRRIVSISEATTLEEAAGDVCALFDNGQGRNEYLVAKLLSRMKQSGVTNIITPGVALEYCNKTTGGGVGLGIVVLRKPLRWGVQTINIFAVFATIDNFTHYPLLHEFYECMEDRDFVRSLMDARDDAAAADVLLRRTDKVG